MKTQHSMTDYTTQQTKDFIVHPNRKTQQETKGNTTIFLTANNEGGCSRNVEEVKADKVRHKKIGQIKTENLKIKSWKDLNILKNKYRVEKLLNKSKEQLFQQNIDIIERVENTAPKIDSWNKTPKFKKSPNDSVLSIRDKLFQQNVQLIDKIENAPPKVSSWNYIRKVQTSPKAKQRELQKQILFEQNMKMIMRIEDTPPRIDAWNHSTLSKKLTEIKKIKRKKSLQKLRSQNFVIVEKVEDAPPKVQSWNSLNTLHKKLKLKKQKFTNPETIGRKLELMKLKIQTAEKDLSEGQKVQKKCVTERVGKFQPKDQLDYRIKRGKQMIQKVYGKEALLKKQNNIPNYSYLLVLEKKQRIDRYKALKKKGVKAQN